MIMHNHNTISINKLPRVLRFGLSMLPHDVQSLFELDMKALLRGSEV